MEPYDVEIAAGFTATERTKIRALRSSIEGIALIGTALSKSFDDIRRFSPREWSERMSLDVLDALAWLRSQEGILADGRVVLHGKAQQAALDATKKEEETLNRIAGLFK